MKKAMKVTVMIALMFFTTLVMSKDIKVIANNADRSLMIEMAATSQPTLVRVIDSEAQIIYNEKMLPGNMLVKKINLSKLPLGDYKVEIENGIKQINYTVVLKATTVTITDRREENKPVFRRKGDRVYLNLLNLEGNKVEILVYDSTGRQLFSESSEGAQLVQKAFNFEDAFSDNYMVMVREADNTYYEEIVVK